MSLLRHTKQWITVAACWAATVASAQWNFRLDTTFRTSIVDQNVNGMAVLENGDLLISGRIRYEEDISTRLISKLDVNGERVVEFPYGHGGGKIVAWNDRFYIHAGIARRLLGSGEADPTYLSTNPSYFSYANPGDFHVFPDGRVLLSGMHMLNDTARGFTGMHNLIWFTNTGRLDTTRIHRKGDGSLYAFARLPDGGFICTSNFTHFDGVPVDWIFRTDSLGVPDTTFHTGVYTGQAFCYVPLADGRIYVGGSFVTDQAPGDTLHLARFLADGTLDPTFSLSHFDDGELSWPFGASVTHLLPWMDGKLLVTGQFRHVNGQPRRSICMIDSTGELLGAFEDCGVGIYEDPFLPYSSIDDVIFDVQNEHLYICGAYVGYNDGTINDTQQRFVSRLLVEEVNVGTDVTLSPPKGMQVDLRPNPSSGRFQLSYPVQPAAGELTVLDTEGKVVHRSRLPGRSQVHEVLLPPAATGLYLCRLQWGQQTLSTRVVIE